MKRRSPNGETHCKDIAVSVTESISYEKTTLGTETSKYQEEKKENSIPLVAASEKGVAQTSLRTGVVGPQHTKCWR